MIYEIYTVTVKLLLSQNVFKCMHMCILSQAAHIMHTPAWAVLMFETLAKREKKNTNLFFCVSFLQHRQIERKNKDRTGKEKKRVLG